MEYVVICISLMRQQFVVTMEYVVICISLMRQQFVVTHRYTILHETEKTDILT
jgi:hypothetical protein